MNTNNQQIVFTFFASSVGSGFFRFTLQSTDDGSIMDVLQIPLEVQGQQDPVYLATSVTITALNTSTTNSSSSGQQFVFNQGIKVPQDAQGSGRLDLTVSLGKEAFIIQNSEYLLQLGNSSSKSTLNPPTPTSVDLLSSMTPVAFFSTMAASSSSNSTVTSSQAFRSLTVSSRAVFNSSLSSLPSYTDSTYGLSYYPIQSSPPTSVDLNLNLYALYVSSRSPFFHQIQSNSIYKKWVGAVSLGWMQSMKPYYFSTNSSSKIVLSSYLYDQLAFTYLALGLDWKAPDSPRTNSPDPNLSLTSLLSQYSLLSTTGKLYLGLAYLLENKTDPILRNISNDVENLIRIQGRTAYVSLNDTGHVDMPATSLSLEFLVLSPFTTTTHVKPSASSSGAKPAFSTTSILPFIASYLANEAVGSGSMNYFSYYFTSTSVTTLVYSLFSLTTNEQKYSDFSPNLKVEVYSGSSDLMTAQFSAEMNAPPIQTSSVNFTNLQQTSKGTYQQLKVTAGPATSSKPASGQVTLTFGMQFVPQIPVSANQTFSHGITVQKILQFYNPVNRTIVSGSIFDQNNKNQSVDVKIGDFVVVTIQVTATDDLTNVRLVDLLPAALQALDTNIYSDVSVPSPPWDTSSRQVFGPIVIPDREPCDWCFYTYQAFNYREYRSDQVIGFAQVLPKGTYTFSYVAFVVSSGSFYVPSCHVYSLEQPEVMGLSRNFMLRSGTQVSISDKSFDSSVCYSA